MKKTITILFLMLFAFYSIPATAAEHCGLSCGLHEKATIVFDGKEYPSSNLADYLRRSGIVLTTFINTTTSNTSNGKITIDASGTFENYQGLYKKNYFYYVIQYNVFDFYYDIQQQDAKGNWISIGSIHKTKNFDPIYKEKLPYNDKGTWPANWATWSFHVYKEICNFSDKFDVDLTYQPNTNNYKIRVIVKITPNKDAPFSKTVSSTNTNHYLEREYYTESCDPFEESFTGGYYQTFNKTYTAEQKKQLIAFDTHTGESNILTFTYNSIGHNIIADNQVNPSKSLKNGTYYLIYGDENAAIKLSLPKENVSAKKNNLPAQSAMVVGVNQNPFPTSVSFCSSSVGDGCGEYNYIEYRKTSPQVLKTALNAYSALANKVRFKGLMLQTEVNELTGKTTFKTPSIVTLGTAESANIWYSKTYKLADMQYATAKISQGTNITQSGNILKVAHKLLYLDLAQLANNHNGFLELGYASSHKEEGKTLISRIATYNDALHIPSSNTLQFYVVPKAIFSNLKEEDLATKYICIPQNNNPTSENEVIILYENKIKSENGTIDALTYEPEYFWEFSYDKKTWNKVDKNNYINPNFDIDKGDLYVKPSILSNNGVVYFRQSAILKAFSSEIKNDLYTESLNNRYYIRINSDQYYTYKKMLTPLEEQFAFENGDEYLATDTKVCFNESELLNGKKIKFSVVSNANMSQEEFEALKGIASYSLTRTKYDGSNSRTETITYDANTGYTITNYDGTKWVFNGTIEFCSGIKLTKSITLEAFPEQTIDIDKIEVANKGASIIFRDKATNELQVMSPKGEDFKIRYFLGDDDRKNLAAYQAKREYTCPAYEDVVPWVPYEDVVPFVPYPEMVPYPEYEPTDFSTWKFGELEDLIISKGWGAGIYWDDVTIGFLRNTARDKEEAEYYQLKQGYEMQYDIDKLAYELQYEADKQAYIDKYNADKDAYYVDCDFKQNWFEFQDKLNYTATLENITDNEESAEFLMRTISKDSCYSNEVKFIVTYFDGIKGNEIAFTDDYYKGKSEISVTAGQGNPFIKGELVEGAYGIPRDNSDCTYTYVWKYYDEQSEKFEVITDDKGNAFEYVERNDGTGNRPSIRDAKYISLDANAIANISSQYPNGLKIARFVYSQKGKDVNAKLEHQSNVLTIFSAELIEEDKFSYYFDEEFCPGKGYAYIEFDDVEFAENEVLEATILTKGQEQLNVLFNYAKKLGGVENPTEDISLSLCRIDTLTKVRSNAVILDIDVPELKADFIVYVDGKEHKLTEDVINVQAGSRVVLYNESENGFDGGSIYNWTLQVQKDGYEAQSSEKEDPVCYLYNPGINTIKLEVVSSNRCRNSVTANNINVILAEGRSYPIISHFEESREQLLSVAPYMNVSPTLLIDESVLTINSNIDRYDVIVTDIAGKVMLTAENLGLRSQLNLDFLPDGIYILHASGNTFKLIKK